MGLESFFTLPAFAPGDIRSRVVRIMNVNSKRARLGEGHYVDVRVYSAYLTILFILLLARSDTVNYCLLQQPIHKVIDLSPFLLNIKPRHSCFDDGSCNIICYLWLYVLCICQNRNQDIKFLSHEAIGYSLAMYLSGNSTIK